MSFYNGSWWRAFLFEFRPRKYAKQRLNATFILSAKLLSLFVVSSHWIFSRRYRIYRKKIYIRAEEHACICELSVGTFLENRGDIIPIGLFDMGSACCVSSSGIQSQYPESHEDGVNRGKMAENEKERKVWYLHSSQCSAHH